MHSKIISRSFITLLVTALTFVIVYKAINIPITYDEDVTWECYIHQGNIANIILGSNGNSNNHILNSISIKFVHQILGNKPWVIRLPNILSFFLLVFCLFFLAKNYFNRSALLFCLPFTAVLLNPYLLDFFSLARGYGMANAFMACSVFCLVKFPSSKNIKWFFAAILFAMAAAYANFTFLLFWVAVHLLLTVTLLTRHYSSAYKKNILVKTAVVAIAFICVCIIPLIRMHDCIQNTFCDRNGFYYDTVLTTINRFIYGSPGYGLSAKNITYAIISVCGLGGLNFLYKILKNPYSTFTDAFNLVFLLLLLVWVLNMVQVHFFNTSYLSNRTALMYYVLFIFAAAFLIRDITAISFWIGQILSGGISFLFIAHFVCAVNLTSVYEWSYDAYTYKVMDYITDYKNQHPNLRNIELNLPDYYRPSFSFYVKTNRLPWFILDTPKGYQAETSSNALFYYTFSENTSQLKNYTVVKRFHPNGIIMPTGVADSDEVLLMHR